MDSAVIALLRESALSLLNPIRKKELIDVNSQNIKSNSMLSESTRPNMADINKQR
ncbi:hypothetical protein D3C73_919320 [compost metagenome]